MKKRSQLTSLGFGGSMVPEKRLGDLYYAIRGDPSLSPEAAAHLLSQIKGMTGYANDSTPLSDLLAQGLGGTIGWLISKYFGLGRVGQIVSTVAGLGIGNAINKQLNKPPNPFPGWSLL